MATLGTFVAGQVLTAAELNQLNNVTALYRTAALSVANATETDVPYGAGTEVVDVSGWHDTSTNTDRITPTVAGIYLVMAQATLSNSSVSSSVRIWTSIHKNTTNVSAASHFAPNYPTTSCHAVVDLNGSTDYVKQRVYHTQGTTQNIDGLRLTLVLLRKS